MATVFISSKLVAARIEMEEQKVEIREESESVLTTIEARSWEIGART
jgi:uncharacterized membrane protein YheB (UPF0754 family)